MKTEGKLIWGALILSGFGLSSCVSTSSYKMLEKDLDGIKAQNASLQQDLDTLKQQNAELDQEKKSLLAVHEDTESQYQNLVGQLQQEVQEGQLKVTQYKNMLTVDVAEKIFFASGSATLKKSGKAVLKKVGQALGNYQDKAILVVGHTDSVPLAKAYQNIFPSNWELSVLRATNVVRFLQDGAGIPPERLLASGHSQYSPVASNNTAEGRQKNRRIEISLLDKNLLSTNQENQPQPVQPEPSATPPEAATTPTPNP